MRSSKTERVLFMLDGKIVGEYKQGKYDETRDDIKAREERLNAWLVEMSFQPIDSRKIQQMTTNNEPKEKNSLLNVLSIRDFRLLFTGVSTSLLGDQFALIATPWLVLQLTGDRLSSLTERLKLSTNLIGFSFTVS